MGRRNTRWTSNVYEIFVIGEQLRQQMHKQGQVRDRRHHLRKHKQCFVGRDVIDWLLKMHHVQSREQAVSAMQILKKHGFFQSVTDECDFKDQNLFYRFTYDDNMYKSNPELISFYWALDIYRKLKENNCDVMQEFYLKGSLYSHAFLGCDLVDLIVVTEGEENRESIIARMRDLLERDVIKHVTDDYHFSDDKLIYEFSLDFDKPCLLQDCLELVSHGNPNEGITDAGMSVKAPGPQTDAVISAAAGIEVPPHDSTTSEVARSPDSGHDEADVKGETTKTFELTLVGRPALDSKGDPGSSFRTSFLRMECDVMGFGFVISGSSPCYVQAVDPLGPAAAVGLKVHQILSNVNGQNVVSMSHREVGQLVAKTTRLSLTVMTPRRNQQN